MSVDPTERAPRWADLPQPIPAEQWSTLQEVQPVPHGLIDGTGVGPHPYGGPDGGGCGDAGDC